MKHKTAAIVLAITALAFASPRAALAASTFYGITKHVSVNNIKVYNPKSKQTLSFVILPKFDRVFSGDGKTTYQMKDVKAGRYVGIIYDQSVLGARHADRIYLLNNANARISAQ